MHHPAIKANCTNTKVTGYLNTIKICLALLLDNALERYHSRQRRANLRDVDEKLRRLRTSARIEEKERVDDEEVDGRLRD
jgi:hypothetical protein